MATPGNSFAKLARCNLTQAALTVLTAGCLLACAPSVALAEAQPSTCDLYASTSGSNANPGTISAPFATAQHLLERLSAGQVGCLTSGQTFAGFTVSGSSAHGAEGEPVTLTSTNPDDPATIDSRVTTENGANWLTFTHLTLSSDVLSETEGPSPTIDSAHTSWTYDDVSAGDIGICFMPDPLGDPYGAAEYTLIEHDRVHDCGHAVTKEELECQSVSKAPVCSAENIDIYEGRENGWHSHGLYDEGQHTTVRNSYFYDNSGVGILLRGGAYAVIEHNVIDANGRGVEFGNEAPAHDTVAWNIITDSTSPCGREVGAGSHCDSYGLLAFGSIGSGDVFRNNDMFGNEAGNVEPGLTSAILDEDNVAVNPLYVNAAAHVYTLTEGSSAAQYGPETGLGPAPTASEPPALPESSPAALTSLAPEPGDPASKAGGNAGAANATGSLARGDVRRTRAHKHARHSKSTSRRARSARRRAHLAESARRHRSHGAAGSV